MSRKARFALIPDQVVIRLDKFRVYFYNHHLMALLSTTYLLRLWAESFVFRLSHLILLPARIRLLIARPSDTWLSYEDLTLLNDQHKREENLSSQKEILQQQKWARRVAQIADIFQAQNILEVGCGNGMAAFHLVDPRREIYATDLADHLYPQVKDSPVIFSTGDVCQELPYESDSFDLVFSINSFEHFYSPETALDEMLRVLRPDGFLFLAFSPLYYSPWGVHASRRLRFPYPQLLFSPYTIHQFVEQNKAALANTYSDFADRNKIGPDLNAYSLDQYRQIFKAQRSRLKDLAYVEVVSLEGLHLIHRYPGIIKTKIPSAQLLFVSGIKLLARKRR